MTFFAETNIFLFSEKRISKKANYALKNITNRQILLVSHCRKLDRFMESTELTFYSDIDCYDLNSF